MISYTSWSDLVPYHPLSFYDNSSCNILMLSRSLLRYFALMIDKQKAEDDHKTTQPVEKTGMLRVEQYLADQRKWNCRAQTNGDYDWRSE